MKREFVGVVVGGWICFTGVAIGQETSGSEPVNDARIIGGVADGTPPPPPPPKEVPNFTILSSKLVHECGRKVSIQRVADPQLPELPPPPPPMTEEELEALRQSPEFQEFAEKHIEQVHFIVSATVYDHRITRLRWWPDLGKQESFECWSNFDWNHMTGFCQFQGRGNLYCTLIMGIGNAPTAEERREMRARGIEIPEPELPDLPSLEENGPVYMLTEGDESDAKAMELMDVLHDLYEAENERLVAAYQGREIARKEREAFLKANPPQPKDVVLRYWRKENPKPLTKEEAR